MRLSYWIHGGDNSEKFECDEKCLSDPNVSCHTKGILESPGFLYNSS